MKAELPVKEKEIKLVLKQLPDKVFWSASLPCCPRGQPKLSMRTMTQLVCPGKGAGTISWPEHASAHLHCTTEPQRQRGILCRAALQLLPAFLKGHWRKGGNKDTREEWASGAVPLVAPAPAFSSIAGAIYQQKRKLLHTQLLRHRKHQRNLCRVCNFQQHHCCSFESPDSTCSFPHPVKFKTFPLQFLWELAFSKKLPDQNTAALQHVTVVQAAVLQTAQVLLAWGHRLREVFVYQTLIG